MAAVEIYLAVHKRPEPPQLQPDLWPSPERAIEVGADELLRRLRWLMTASSGTIANIAHQLESHAAELDDDAWEQLRDDVLVLDEDIACSKSCSSRRLIGMPRMNV